MACAIGSALISAILQPMAAKAMNIIKDKGKAIVRSMADRAMEMVVDNIERDISRLQTTLYTIKGIVQVAEDKQIDDDFIRNWLRDLVDIGYEARDVLDDFITFSSCINTTEEASNPVNFISSFMLSYFGGSSSDTSKQPLAVLNQLAKDIKGVRERFDEKKKEAKEFKDVISVVGGGGSESVRVNSRSEVGPYLNQQGDNLFLGREEVKEGITKKILQPDYDRVDLVAICGMGGIGKTTLAQSIYNDEIVEKNVPRRWLCVGESKFRAEKVIREILNDKETIGIVNLQTKLVEKLRGDRFLIVLDDVWDVDGSEWDKLFNPLTNVKKGLKGGMIIITTRKREVCVATNTQTTYDLKPLSEEDSWSIFESCAYKDGKSDTTRELKDIGKEIVKKLNGHPLALKVVGGSLLDKDSSTWTNFLESNDWMLIDDENHKDKNIMSVLRWSYNHLPSHLKMCFTYCALFPKDRVLDKKVLVEMWMAHDLIEKEKQQRPEDVGAQYFEKLVNASLLQCVDDGEYMMHDLIHDLAQHVSNGEFATANGSLSIDQMVRHITITPGDYSEIPRLCKIEKLLTLYTTVGNIYRTKEFDHSVLDDVFKQLKSIRVLVLASREITDIPNCISELKHLRYLDVSETLVKSLPDSLCRLYNLQMIAAPFFIDLPRDIVNMVNLRYVRGNLSTCKGVGKLTSLQELSSIRVCEGDSIRELGDMPKLRGKFEINGLENFTTSEDAAGAKMEKQTLMDTLILKFYQHPANEDAAESINSVEVLDKLGYPPNLTYLMIFGYTGVKPPSWMVDGKHKLHRLHKLELSCCSKLESLPPLGELTSLKHLSLKGVGVKRLGDEFYGKFTDGKVFFPSLESLQFIQLYEWEEWDDIIIENSSVSFFPRLTTLKLYECTKLESLPRHGGFDKLQTLRLLICPKLESLPPLGEMTSLQDLYLDKVGVKRLGHEFYGKFTDGKVFFPSLESLQFIQLYEWEEWDDIIIENSSVSFFPRLTTLKLHECPKLESLPRLGEMTSLQDLYLYKVGVKRLGHEFYRKFTDGKVFFPSLKSLELHQLYEWEEWDDIIIENSSMSFFPRLTSLILTNCPKLESLPCHGGFDKLQTLRLSDCPKLESLPPLGELTSLEDLSLQNVGVKRLGDEFYGKFTDGKVFFPSLESLQFIQLYEWEEWDDIIIENSSMSFFPCLTSLILTNCPKLESLPCHGWFDKLQTLRLLRCPKLVSLPPLGEMTSLQDLYLNKVGIKRLGHELYGKFTDGKVFFPSLESLEFIQLYEWEEWDDIIIENSSMSFFPRLTSLKLYECPKLESLPRHGGFDKLQTLRLLICLKLESLPPLGEMTSLQDLYLDKVGVKRLGHEFYGKFTDGKVFFPSLESLQFIQLYKWEEWDDIIIENSSISFFPRLTTLKLHECPKLESLPRLGGFNKLQKLKLSDCPKLESLPPLGELTSLEDLSLQNVGVKRLGDEFYGKFTDGKVFFPSLESLTFDAMDEWEEWDDIIIKNLNVSFFPRLTRLVIVYCPKLESLPRHGGFDKLQTLELFNCPKLESLPPLGELTSLKRLSLHKVGVKRLGDEFYGKFTDGKVFFPSLESLYLGEIQEWKEWDDIIIKNSSVSFFPHLMELVIFQCPKLVSVLPVKNPIMNAANFMKSLSRLEIINCRNLQSLPADGFPPSLRDLTIKCCPLLYERCKDESGLDWHMINRIPDKDIREHW